MQNVMLRLIVLDGDVIVLLMHYDNHLRESHRMPFLILLIERTEPA
jgi:hypothetical protein